MAEQPVDGQGGSDGSSTSAPAGRAEAGWPRRDEATTRISKAALGGADEKTAVLAKPVVGKSTPVKPADAAPAPEPAVADSKAVEPEPVKPEAVKPEPVEPKAANPEAANPEAVKSEAVKPEPADSEPTNSKSTAPESADSKPSVPESADAVKPPASKADESTQAALTPVTDEPEPAPSSSPEAVVVAAHVAAPAPVVDTEPATERVARPDTLDGYDRQPPAESWVGAPVHVLHAFHRDRPKVVVQRDIPSAIKVFSTTSLLGLPIGLLWAWLAPAQNAVVQSGGFVPVPGESYHRLDSLMVFVLLGLAAGVLTGTGSWMMRELRGPVVMLAATVGSVLAAFLAFRVGAPLSTWHYELASAPVVGEVIRLAPSLDSAWGIVAWPLGTALAYGCLAAWNGMDDLGRRLA
ncbi:MULTISPECIES: DUF2567 domain-containing protein [Actinosynnema]|uniref:DUF2567 domain-containing protein n=1 Tax=Actinosynnema TaxID=40566 RepID=UPI0020A3C655|nr:DUF2567 domain-containing protein [Actinosynnema pretiosum]MCP2094154.1 Protein of unknown function (DUF2567) [Actinosynnema pretiosum]